MLTNLFHYSYIFICRSLFNKKRATHDCAEKFSITMCTSAKPWTFLSRIQLFLGSSNGKYLANVYQPCLWCGNLIIKSQWNFTAFPTSSVNSLFLLVQSTHLPVKCLQLSTFFPVQWVAGYWCKNTCTVMISICCFNISLYQ